MASNHITRLLLFQFLLLFSYHHYQTFTKSAYNFKDNIKELTSYYPSKIPQLDTILKQPEKLFKYFLITNVVLGITSIFGFRLCQLLAGYMTIIIAIIYCNPIKTILANLRRSGTNDYINFIPTTEFIGLFALGLGMMGNAFLFESERQVKNTITIEETPKDK